MKERSSDELFIVKNDEVHPLVTRQHACCKSCVEHFTGFQTVKCVALGMHKRFVDATSDRQRRTMHVVSGEREREDGRREQR